MSIEKSVLPGEPLPAHLAQPDPALPIQPRRRLRVTHETPSLHRGTGIPAMASLERGIWVPASDSLDRGIWVPRWHHWSGDLGPDDGIPAPPAPGHTRNTIPAPPDLDPGECFPGPGDLRQENVRDRRPRGFTGCHHWSGGSGSRRWHPCTAGSRSHTKHHPCTAGSGTRRVLPWTGGSPAGERAKLAASWIHRLSSPVPPYTRVLIRLVQKSTWRSLPDSCWRWIRAGGCHLLCSASL